MRSSSGGPSNLRETGKALGLSPSTVLRRIHNGDLEAERDGSRWVIYPAAIMAYRKARRFESFNGHEGILKMNGTTISPLTEQEKAVLEECSISWS